MAAKNKFLNAMKMPSIDDMFSSEADRQRESGDLVTEVPLSELHPFVGHPIEVRDDEDSLICMQRNIMQTPIMPFASGRTRVAICFCLLLRFFARP